MTHATNLFCSLDAARVVYAHIPLMQRSDGPRRLALFFGEAVVLEVGDRPAGQLEYPGWDKSETALCETSRKNAYCIR